MVRERTPDMFPGIPQENLSCSPFIVIHSSSKKGHTKAASWVLHVPFTFRDFRTNTVRNIPYRIMIDVLLNNNEKRERTQGGGRK
jgi:hypothetical protein